MLALRPSSCWDSLSAVGKRPMTTRMLISAQEPIHLSPSHLHSVGIITLKNRTLSLEVQLFVEHAREVSKVFTKRQ